MCINESKVQKFEHAEINSHTNIDLPIHLKHFKLMYWKTFHNFKNKTSQY